MRRIVTMPEGKAAFLGLPEVVVGPDVDWAERALRRGWKPNGALVHDIPQWAGLNCKAVPDCCLWLGSVSNFALAYVLDHLLVEALSLNERNLTIPVQRTLFCCPFNILEWKEVFPSWEISLIASWGQLRLITSTLKLTARRIDWHL